MDCTISCVPYGTPGGPLCVRIASLVLNLYKYFIEGEYRKQSQNLLSEPQGNKTKSLNYRNPHLNIRKEFLTMRLDKHWSWFSKDCEFSIFGAIKNLTAGDFKTRGLC